MLSRPSLIAICFLLCAFTSTAKDTTSEKFTILKTSISPNGRYGVNALVSTRDGDWKNAVNNVVEIPSDRVLATLTGDTWVHASPDDSAQNHHSLQPCWSADSSVLAWILGGKWFSDAFNLVKIQDGKALWQVNVLKSVQDEIIARTKAAAPKNYAAAKLQNKGNGSAYPEGFSVDIETPEAGFSLPLKCHVTLTSNPKEIEDWPANAWVDSSMDVTINPDGAVTYSNFKITRTQ